jgi:hypothetical protein
MLLASLLLRYCYPFCCLLHLGSLSLDVRHTLEDIAMYMQLAVG